MQNLEPATATETKRPAGNPWREPPVVIPLLLVIATLLYALFRP